MLNQNIYLHVRKTRKNEEQKWRPPFPLCLENIQCYERKSEGVIKKVNYSFSFNPKFTAYSGREAPIVFNG